MPGPLTSGQQETKTNTGQPALTPREEEQPSRVSEHEQHEQGGDQRELGLLSPPGKESPFQRGGPDQTRPSAGLKTAA